MEKINRIPNLLEGEGYKKRIREENERCFLKDKQQVYYDSFILLEIIPFEKIDQLIAGLDELYINNPLIGKSMLNYKECLSNFKSKIFYRFNIPLSPILNSNKKLFHPISVSHALQEDINSIHISITKIMSSSVLLKIDVRLDNSASDKINNIIYQYHKETKEIVKIQKEEIVRIYDPEVVKEKEVCQFKQDIHKETVDFLSKYFQGIFFEKAKDHISIVPSIDLFSLVYPEEERGLIDWGFKYRGFFSCLGTIIGPEYSFKYKNYLFCTEVYRNVEFNNYTVFMNKNMQINNNTTSIDINNSIKREFAYFSFDLFAIGRWVSILESLVGELNLRITQEISNIQKDKFNFNEAIEERKTFLKDIIPYKRFTAEYKSFGHNYGSFPFTSINYNKNENDEGQSGLFEYFNKNIISRINGIDSLMESLTKQYGTILNLKNLEFNKNMQTTMCCLTILIFIFTLIQIFK
ncbi:MAG: hypothetical protein RBT05_09010 [Bacteroidales bacterium]|jgi:hypothetical protein|nr:hypothetical protein [Bacteroidales bacterium]